MKHLRRLREWWREPLDVWDSDFPDSGYPQHQFDDPVPDGFDLRAMQPPLSFLNTFPGEQEDDK